MQPTNPTSWPQVKLRLPPDLRSRLAQRALANQRSQTGEVNFILQQQRKLDQKAGNQ